MRERTQEWFEGIKEVKALTTRAYSVRIERPVNVSLSPSFLSDILVTAVEGGINYWARISSPVFADVLTEGRSYERSLIGVDVSDIDGGRDFRNLPVTIETIRDGLAKLVESSTTDPLIRPDIARSIRSAVEQYDAGEIDAEGADCIVQTALFDSVVYG